MDFLKKDKWLSNPVALKIKRKNKVTPIKKSYYFYSSLVRQAEIAINNNMVSAFQRAFTAEIFTKDIIMKWVESNVFPVPYPNK